MCNVEHKIPNLLLSEQASRSLLRQERAVRIIARVVHWRVKADSIPLVVEQEQKDKHTSVIDGIQPYLWQGQRCHCHL